MLLTNVFLTITLSFLQLCRTDQEIQFQHMIVSEEKSAAGGPGFGWSLAVAHMGSSPNLFIGSPSDDGGYILTDIQSKGKIFPPQGYNSFGESFDANENFIAVNAEQWMGQYSVYCFFIYSATSPYSMVARISVGGKVLLKLMSDNSIIAATGDGYLTVYRYTHHSSWEKGQRMILENYKAGDIYGDISLSVSGNMLAVGYYEQQSLYRGRVNTYIKADKVYVLMKTIPTPGDAYFGVSVSLDDQHLVVSGDRGFYTYMLNPSTGQWINNGYFLLPYPVEMPSVFLRDGVLAATLSDESYPEVCAYLYKFSNNNNNNSNNTTTTTTTTSNNNTNSTTTNNNGNGDPWRKVATLKTNGVPVKYYQLHHAVLIERWGELAVVITGRNDWVGDDYGKVFSHDISAFYDKNH